MSGFGGFPDLPGFGKEQLQFVVKARRSFIRTLFVYATVISLVVSLIVLGVSQFITPDYSSQAYTDKDGKRHYEPVRLPDEGKVVGVCSGLAYYFKTDPLYFRAAFVVAYFVFGAGIGVYIVAWILMDDAKTPGNYLERTARTE